MSARSMTGFALQRRTIGPIVAVISVKSVNHRGLDLHFHLPQVLEPFEPLARNAIKAHVERGHVQVRVGIERGTAHSGDGAIDVAALERWTAAYREAASILQSNEPPHPSEALRVPGVLKGEAAIEWSPTLASELNTCFADALAELNAFRQREGQTIAVELETRANRLAALAFEMECKRSIAIPALQRRLNERIGALLGGLATDPQRIAQEAAILADRSDITEEILRLKTHAKQLLSQLQAPGEKGKKLDFLLQEMGRESNTVLSKTSGLGEDGLTITSLALEAKAEIEKMREQTLNLE